jgi:hypothetical protein
MGKVHGIEYAKCAYFIITNSGPRSSERAPWEGQEGFQCILCRIVVRGSPSGGGCSGGPGGGGAQWSIPEKLRTQLAGAHNESQLAAVQAGLSRSPVVLIQASPHSGLAQWPLEVP